MIDVADYNPCEAEQCCERNVKGIANQNRFIDGHLSLM